MAKRSRPVLALALGTLAAPFVVEAALHVLSAFVAVDLRGGRAGEAPAILCVGDSNTYGIRLAAEDSYPGQLQAFLAAAGDPHVVVNQGYPGQNTTQVRAGLEETLRELRPDAVVVFAGVNDRWSDEGRPLWGDGGAGLAQGLLARSRLVQLLRLARAEDAVGSPTAASDPAGRLPDDRFPPPPDAIERRPSLETRKRIRANLEPIAELCARRGAVAVLVGYPLFSESVREDVNGSIRRAAEVGGARYVDLEARFEELTATLGRDELYLPDDGHLSAVGNHEAARLVLAALRDAGVVSADVPPPLERAYGGVALALEREGDELQVALEGPPNWVWRLALDDGERPSTQRELALGRRFLGPDELGVVEPARWRGRFDAEGRARTSLSLPEAGAARRLAAVAQKREGAPRDVRFSPAVPLPAPTAARR